MRDTTLGQCLYSTAHPEFGKSEVYIVYAEVHPKAADENACWVIKEEHGWFQDSTKTFLKKTVTLSPEAEHCMDLREAFKEIHNQVVSRAKGGFKYLFQLDPYTGGHRRFEIQQDGSRVEI